MAGLGFALGLDFGTESIRAIAVSCENGDEVAQAVCAYEHGVITTDLPPDFALQNPDDYLNSAVQAIQEVLRKVPATKIVGIGVDFTACTILPILKDGTPLMKVKRFRENPHSWVKLWKHHAAQPEAEIISDLARKRGEKFLQYYSGAISSEWMLPKCWEILRHAPEVYAAADYIIDAGDWFVQQMTGEFTRNSCAAGYKGMWNAELGFPAKNFLQALDPALADLEKKWVTKIVAPGNPAGKITGEFARLSGLKEGTPVSAATIDAHSGVPGVGVSGEGPMCIIMGTSSCHMVLSRELKLFPGFAGVVKDGIIPGFYGYESGQPAVGDIFGWYAKKFLERPFVELTEGASRLKPGQGGLVALDWMNGNRSVLMNADLSGAIVGVTLETRPEEFYRALLEASAFGTRAIVDSYQNGGVPITELVVCGGLVNHPLIMQIYADVCQMKVRVAASNQAVALGAAMFGALAAGQRRGGFDDIPSAIQKMAKPYAKTYEPNSSYRGVYDDLYSIYSEMQNVFGREKISLMKRLKDINRKSRES